MRPDHPSESTGQRARAQNGSVIDVRGVTKSFRREIAVEQASFQVPHQVIFGLVGPSGAGKTTLIRMLTGIHIPDEGHVSVLGVAPASFGAEQRLAIGYMPQQFSLYPRLTVGENMQFVASMYGMGLSRHRRIREALDLVELRPHLGKQARRLSGGMQRRLSLAAAMVHSPTLVFLDEPTAGVDPILRKKLWQGFEQLREAGKTLFITTQYVNEAGNCDLVAVLSRGKIVAVDTPAGLRAKAFGGEILEIKLARALTPEEAAALRRAAPAQAKIVELDSTRLRIVVAETKSAIPTLMAWFASRGVEIHSMEAHHPPLDDVFVELIENGDGRAHV